MTVHSRVRAAAITMAGVLFASLLAATSPLAAAADDAVPGEQGRISGVITGAVAEHAGLVYLYRNTGDDWDEFWGAEMPLTGRYELTGLPSGDYRVSFVPYVTGGSAVGWGEWWDDAATAAESTTIHLAAGEHRDDIDADLRTLDGERVTAEISGRLAVGSTLTAVPGHWDTGTEISYFWQVGGVDAGEGMKLAVTPAMLGKKVQLRVMGASGDSTPRVRLAKESVPVVAGTLTSATPTISGTLAVGSTVTAKTAAWTKGTSLSYQWYASGKAISTATKSTLTLPTSLAGKTLAVKITGKKSGYTTVSKTSKVTAKVATASTPTISGTAKAGKKLTAKPGTWTARTTFTYRWYANGVSIRNATKSTLTLTNAHKGKKITVKVTGKKSGYATVSKTSRAKTVAR